MTEPKKSQSNAAEGDDERASSESPRKQGIIFANYMILKEIKGRDPNNFLTTWLGERSTHLPAAHTSAHPSQKTGKSGAPGMEKGVEP
jgi:hypothetical protein